MINISFKISNFVRMYLPNALTLAIILTFLSLIMAIIFTDNTFVNLIGFWQDGLWTLLTFGMQATILLLSGQALMRTKIFNAILNKIVDIPKTGRSAVAFVSFIGLVLWLIQWGLGMIGAALLAYKVGRRFYETGKKIHYPLLCAAAYASLLTYESGLSAAVSLFIATPGHAMEEMLGIIPLTETIFGLGNILTTILILIFVPMFFYLIHPKDDKKIKPIDNFVKQSELENNIDNQPTSQLNDETQIFPNEKVDKSPIIAWAIGLMGIFWTVSYVITNGLILDMNSINVFFISLGIILTGNLKDYADSFGKGISSASGIILQFPFYGGIMGIVTASGLALVIANWFVSISNEFTFPIFAFLGAGLLNFFVPSGGGQWAVQGPIIIEAASLLDVNMIKTIMAVSYGDVWTNLLQPFWALATVGIMRIKVTEIMGYTASVIPVVGLIYIIMLALPIW